MLQHPKASLIIIGNEILSGRTQDKNAAYIGKELVKLGIRMSEIRVIADIENIIVNTVNELRARDNYVFTTGGIGPTHDDITSSSVAKAFGVEIIQHPEATKRLEEHYKKHRGSGLNEARLRMANIPQGGELIDNIISGAPGFKIDNVYVMAGVPDIMRAMFDSFKHTLVGGKPILARTVEIDIPEGNIAHPLAEIQNNYIDVEIGSYPFVKGTVLATNVVLRGTDENTLIQVEEEIIEAAKQNGAENIIT